MTQQAAYYITTPIYYVNDVPHIGHAYTTTACDVLARFNRLAGSNVLFATGADEHGQKVEKSALAAGVAPQVFCDRVAARFNALNDQLNIALDCFVRTTSLQHQRACKHLWQTLVDNGHIYLDNYAGWYSVRDEAFYAESELSTNAQGEKIAPTGAPVEWVEEQSYFFRLSAFQQPLLDWYKNNPNCVLPAGRYNEVVSFVSGGLKDLSISRSSFRWGIPVPGNDQHIMYVWIDALTNYLTAVGYPDTSSAVFNSFWPCDLHVIGRDILRFHAVYWPAILMAAGISLPKRIFAHGWWTNQGQKISKSLGNVIDPMALIEHYGVDQVRYFLMREVPFGNDGDFSPQALVTRINSDLANDLGNLAQRCLAMIHKNCEAMLPTPGPLSAEDQALLGSAQQLLSTINPLMQKQAFNVVLETVWQLIAKGNAYFAQQEPWSLKKSDPARMATVLYVTAETLRHIAIILQCFMPQAMHALLDQLNVAQPLRQFDQLKVALTAGSPLPKPQGIFPRYQDIKSQAS